MKFIKPIIVLLITVALFVIAIIYSQIFNIIILILGFTFGMSGRIGTYQLETNGILVQVKDIFKFYKEEKQLKKLK